MGAAKDSKTSGPPQDPSESPQDLGTPQNALRTWEPLRTFSGPPQNLGTPRAFRTSSVPSGCPQDHLRTLGPLRTPSGCPQDPLSTWGPLRTLRTPGPPQELGTPQDPSGLQATSGPLRTPSGCPQDPFRMPSGLHDPSGPSDPRTTSGPRDPSGPPSDPLRMPSGPQDPLRTWGPLKTPQDPLKAPSGPLRTPSRCPHVPKLSSVPCPVVASPFWQSPLPTFLGPISVWKGLWMWYLSAWLDQTLCPVLQGLRQPSRAFLGAG